MEGKEQIIADARAALDEFEANPDAPDAVNRLRTAVEALQGGSGMEETEDMVDEETGVLKKRQGMRPEEPATMDDYFSQPSRFAKKTGM